MLVILAEPGSLPRGVVEMLTSLSVRVGTADMHALI